ncbi:hypothetical protein [Kribbella sp. CA-294648]|uniref:hypothetical protein n=1 Tax=Kribbella sp. CA-294648 TaxID=3239948 RepID=UPI003D8ADDE2
MPAARPPAFALSAWIDESIIVGGNQHPGAYTLASVVADPALLDGRDRSLVDSARRTGLLSGRLAVDFALPVQEPMLWLPDAVAGAVTAAQLGEPRWLLTLSECVHIHHVSVR